MKMFSILAAGLVVLGVTTASAQTVVRITGSTAFRNQTITATMKIFGATVNGSGGTTTFVMPAGSKFGFSGSSGPVGANNLIIYGTRSGQDYIVKMTFSGSNAGIQATAGSLAVQFYNPTATFGSGTVESALTTTGASLPTTGTPAVYQSEIPDITMMDTAQAATPFRGSYLGQSYTTLTAPRVGVIPYKWIASPAALAVPGMTTMTPSLAQAQWIGLGRLPLALYTGNAADEGNIVYATGRNAGSGTRNAALTESRIGATTQIKQYRTTGANAGTLYPALPILGIDYEEGDGGEESGSTVATNLRTATPANRIYVSYLGLSDANRATNTTDTTIPGSPCKELAWNGVPYSVDNVRNGSYTFWTYQLLGYRSGYSGNGLALANALITQIRAEDSTPRLDQMRVTRAADGGVVTPDYLVP